MILKIFLALAALLILAQFIRPDRNESDDRTYDISTKYTVPDDVNHVLQVACNDCHTNKTVYPWYYNVQPVAWWLDNHITDGKRHLNFSEFTKRPIAVQNHKLEEIVEMVEEKEMPIKDYTYLGMHPDANLTDAQRELIINWAKEQMAMLKATYPADSLKMKPRQPAPAS
ncbi:cytochrome C [Cytophagaceae bacterium SJW1-29]|uniref:Cytochrome C n=2 Tax=Salmonirosea aquatica TaxID=2654236 RepID=A0A7C9BBB0_9BACT|nr:cytochrome C [Cytophagaceae bacterium SJW1-29]